MISGWFQNLHQTWQCQVCLEKNKNTTSSQTTHVPGIAAATQAKCPSMTFKGDTAAVILGLRYASDPV